MKKQQLLDQKELSEIFNTAIDLRLDTQRIALLSELPNDFSSGLQKSNDSKSQLLLDLNSLNGIPILADGKTVPLESWLRMAIQLTRQYKESAVLKEHWQTLLVRHSKIFTVHVSQITQSHSIEYAILTINCFLTLLLLLFIATLE